MAANFRRTLCKFFLEGRCQKGAACDWSHDEGGAGPGPARPAARAPPVKRTLCKFFLQGRCEAGEGCTWAHGEEELGAPVAAAEEGGAAPGEIDWLDEAALDAEIAAAAEELELEELGGEAADGAPEEELELEPGGEEADGELAEAGGLRPPALGLGTKRTICKFWQEGRCKNGDGCTWAHGEDDIGSPAPFADEGA
ncbi:unnamed protein product, partial [Prorocentrum cordatum]